MEIIKGYCCHSKEVCSWPSFLSLLSKVNRLNWTARITKRGAFLAWISPPKKNSCAPFYIPNFEFFRTGVLEGLFDWKPFILQLFVSLLFFRQWQQEMRVAALADSQQEPAAAGSVTEKCWSPPGTQEAAEPSTVTLTQGPTGKGQPQHKLHFQGWHHGWLHKAQGAVVPLSQAPELLHSAVQ